MKRIRMFLMGMSAAVMLAASGCGFSGEEAVTPTPVPTVTATPTPLPTSTPTPTPTPLPRLIGAKTPTAKMIYLTNSMKTDIRQLYVKASGADDWGRSLIPNESIVRTSEQVRMYYTPHTSGEKPLYDLKLTTKDGNTYEIYSVDLGDMEKANLHYDANESIAYLRYMSLSGKKEMNTRENAQQTWDDDWDDYDDDYDWEITEETYYYDDDDSDDYDDSEDVVIEEDTDYDTEEDITGDNDSWDDSYVDDSYEDDSYVDDSYVDDSYEDDSYTEDDNWDDSWDDGYIDDGLDIPWEEYYTEEDPGSVVVESGIGEYSVE